MQVLTSKKGQTSAAPTSTCCFRSRQRLSQTVCQLASPDDAEAKHEHHLKANLGKAALFSFAFAPLAVALPACFTPGGHDGSGMGGGGGGDGDGSGNGGSGQGDNNGTNVIADIAEEEDDVDEDDDEDDEEDEEVGLLPRYTQRSQSADCHCIHALLLHFVASSQ